MEKPFTKKEDVVDILNGIEIHDSYRWLENGDDSKVKEWVSEQNRYTHSILNNDEFKIFSDELVKNFKVANFSVPISYKGRYFYTERKPNEDQSVLYMKVGLDGEPIKLVDPNTIDDNKTTTIDYWFESSTVKYLAYGLSKKGDEMATLYIRDLETGKDLKENIVHCRHSNVRWLPDDSGFFYTRQPRPGTVSENEKTLHTKVYFHLIGNDPDNDELVFGKDRSKEEMINLKLSIDGKYLAIESTTDWTKNDVYIYEVDNRVIKPMIFGVNAKSQPIFLKDKVILYTNYKANNERVLWAPINDMYNGIDTWQELIPEKEYLLKSLRVTKSKIIAEYFKNVCSEILIFDHFGKEVSKIPLPEYSCISDITSRRIEEEFFYGVNSFLFPNMVFRFDSDSGKYEEFRKTDNPINPNDYEVKQEWYKSRDGTDVPMFIWYKKGLVLNGRNSTVLHGYGGFGISRRPMFTRIYVPWVERGGIFALANIRGGGEFGDSWHKDGIHLNKQNSFDDFIAGAEHLISRNYTNSERLGILGGSNGGLLVSATSVQRPELFRAVCSQVPLIDMVRFHKFGMGIRWRHEYGNPEDITDLRSIIKWSPYHNVKSNVEYPSTLFTTAVNDTRVDPMHARKMTASLQEVNKKNDILLFTETDAGHGAGKPISKIVEDKAMELAFFAKKLGLKVK